MYFDVEDIDSSVLDCNAVAEGNVVVVVAYAPGSKQIVENLRPYLPWGHLGCRQPGPGGWPVCTGQGWRW